MSRTIRGRLRRNSGIRLGRWAGSPAFLHCRVIRVRVNVRRSIILTRPCIRIYERSEGRDETWCIVVLIPREVQRIVGVESHDHLVSFLQL